VSDTGFLSSEEVLLLLLCAADFAAVAPDIMPRAYVAQT
jgi:hypothetical protein